MRSPVAPSRIRALNARPVNPRGDFVLYWMIAARRTRWNFALQHAVDLCAELKAPLLILEALDSDYPWANDRIHRFVLDGMAANAAACRAFARRVLPVRGTHPRCWCGPHRRAVPVCLCGGHGLLPRVSDPRRDRGRRPSKRGPARSRRFERPHPALSSWPCVHDGAVLSRLRAARAARPPARVSGGTSPARAAAGPARGRSFRDCASLAGRCRSARSPVVSPGDSYRSRRDAGRPPRRRIRRAPAAGRVHRDRPEASTAATTTTPTPTAPAACLRTCTSDTSPPTRCSQR